MYLSSDAVLQAIIALRSVTHPFVGITFIACKRFGLSVGDVDSVSLDSLTRNHLDEHHRIDRRSSNYFQPFKSASWWVAEKYPSSGLQTVNTQTFERVFLHPRKSKLWGFDVNYVSNIVEVLEERGYQAHVPVDALAVWLYKGRDLGGISDFESLVSLFYKDYSITAEELQLLFRGGSLSDLLSTESGFVDDPLEMNAVAQAFPPPPDAEAERGRTITSLSLRNVGPATAMDMEFGSRLSVITGDNGLGKSFLLDFTWWAATGQWAGSPVTPDHRGHDAVSSVGFGLAGESGRTSNFRATFDRSTFDWERPTDAMTVEALGVFSRADGSFAVADPMRGKFNRVQGGFGELTISEVWNGKLGVNEGLIRDWVKWQGAADRQTFNQLQLVLKRLSPEDLGPLVPGNPVRLPGEPREIPTITHRYGNIPVTQASAGVQRVLMLAYLIIWSWQEHELAASYLEKEPLRRILVIVDELEAHLHPKWQRIVLPALMSVGDILSGDLSMQLFAATHSPMILASMEASFNENTDVLYHLYGDGPQIKLEETPLVKYGDVSGWLTSPLFGLRHARSREAEQAIEAAKMLQLEENVESPRVMEVSERLRRYLPSDDKFWPRWLFFAENHGVNL